MACLNNERRDRLGVVTDSQISRPERRRVRRRSQVQFKRSPKQYNGLRLTAYFRSAEHGYSELSGEFTQLVPLTEPNKMCARACQFPLCFCEIRPQTSSRAAVDNRVTLPIRESALARSLCVSAEFGWMAWRPKQRATVVSFVPLRTHTRLREEDVQSVLPWPSEPQRPAVFIRKGPDRIALKKKRLPRGGRRLESLRRPAIRTRTYSSA